MLEMKKGKSNKVLKKKRKWKPVEKTSSFVFGTSGIDYKRSIKSVPEIMRE